MIWTVYIIVPIQNQRFYKFSKETAVREKKPKKEEKKKKNNNSLSEQNYQRI